ncbi:zinc-dependent metalloprotease [Psychrobium sp. MM17-31]|uniref:zinc-dependent metalloprotease n=1 Tax=Psychrobium sp. MM17-31 TaxID=2917758 RepID=UPI001EF41821|nr:zinc-dependent metalloprotease [Psychrobium sp. MM17-31]MCG7531404.1 zinc-dependent metalloprotease [Psychrobium sp. MM17-31]
MRLIKTTCQLLALSTLLSTLSFGAFAAKFDDKTKNLTAKKGLFTLYGGKNSSSMLLSVDKLEQPFIYVTSLMQGVGSNDIGLDRGQIGQSRLVQFERYGEQIVLRQLNTDYRAYTNNPSEELALTQAFAESILYRFDIVAKQGERFLIDVSKFSKQDFHGIASSLARSNQGSYSLDNSRSVINWGQSKSFPRNTELSSIVTFKGKPKGYYLSSVTPDARYVSIKFRHSFVALPEAGYEPRQFHPYSGYFSFGFDDYSQPIDKPLTQRYITRHRLQFDNNGKVVKPITYYLDPGVPEPVRGALLDGARWWKTAFEKAGLHNAYEVKMLPADADPLDVRYNVIQWVHRSTRGWSYGSSVVDPRTGEILKGHVTLGSLRVKQDYLIASGLLAGQANSNQRAQEMALARIRQLSAHEVGHTLGIAHNFAASTNDRASVMDYPHPLITLENNKIDVHDAYGVGMGLWDDYTVAYGYGNLSDTQLKALRDKTMASGLKFISDSEARAASGSNPWAHLWDNGKYADQELSRLMKVRNKALANLDKSILDDSQAQSDLREALVPIYLLHRFQVTAANKIIAGVDFNYALRDEALTQQPVDGKWQRKALASVLSTLKSQYLVFPEQLLSKLPAKSYGTYNSRESASSQMGRQFDPLSLGEASARHSLNTLLNSARINRLMVQHAQNTKQLSVEEVIDALASATIEASEDYEDKGLVWLTTQRTNAVVIEQLLKLLHSNGLSVEAQQLVSTKVNELQKSLAKKGKRQNTSLKRHFAWLAQQLASGIKDSKHKVINQPAKMPPGSPI